MNKGTLARWVRVEGDVVKVGDVLAEIETDKAMMELESVGAGVLTQIVIPQGTSEVSEGTVLAILRGPSDPAPLSELPLDRAGSPMTSPHDSASGEESASRGSALTGSKNETGRIFVSPLAKRLALDSGIDLGGLRGSGPHGRIIERDVSVVVQHRGSAEVETALSIPQVEIRPMSESSDEIARPAEAPDREVCGGYVEVPHDALRKSIARRLLQSKQTVPHFYLTVDCDLERLLILKQQLTRSATLSGESAPPAQKFSVNDFIIKAWALAVARVPEVNVSWTESAMLKYHDVDVGVAVAIPGGIITPIVRRADTKRLSDISGEMSRLVDRARGRKLTRDEYVGGTTAVSNLGMLGIKSFAAIVNPPHSTILAIGAAEKRVAVKNDAVSVTTLMSCTLSADHRAVDGSTGARVLAQFKRLIENPVEMLV